MSLRILVDMSLSPDWVPLLIGHQHVAVHWSTVGPAGADDQSIMAWAKGAGYVIFTHDLDFGTILALTHAVGPVSSRSVRRTYCRTPPGDRSSRHLRSTNPNLLPVQLSSLRILAGACAYFLFEAGGGPGVYA